MSRSPGDPATWPLTATEVPVAGTTMRFDMERATMASEKLFYSVDEACEATGIKRSLLYELLRRGQVPSRKLGGRRLFPVAALERWAQGLDERALEAGRAG